MKRQCKTCKQYKNIKEFGFQPRAKIVSMKSCKQCNKNKGDKNGII